MSVANSLVSKNIPTVRPKDHVQIIRNSRSYIYVISIPPPLPIVCAQVLSWLVYWLAVMTN